ncbi:TPA: hypothetical protein QCU59_003728 [Bacillus cereus]|nr:hypothetical protein [Bacillus cereus]
MAKFWYIDVIICYLGDIMEKNELFLLFDKFKPNADAVQTNRGFFYQYLKTLKSWLISAIDETGGVIYCKTEGDIKEVNSK